MTDYRTTPEDVRTSLVAQGGDLDFEVDLLGDAQIELIGIQPANLEVDERLNGSGQSASRLEQIERCLAGHFILSSGIDEIRQLDQESLDDGSSYQYAGDRDDSGYQSTSLGQQAVALDQSGKLASVNKPSPVIRSPDSRGPQRGRGRGRR